MTSPAAKKRRARQTQRTAAGRKHPPPPKSAQTAGKLTTNRAIRHQTPGASFQKRRALCCVKRLGRNEQESPPAPSLGSRIDKRPWLLALFAFIMRPNLGTGGHLEGLLSALSARDNDCLRGRVCASARALRRGVHVPESPDCPCAAPDSRPLRHEDTQPTRRHAKGRPRARQAP